jgi:hypothetical protein
VTTDERRKHARFKSATIMQFKDNFFTAHKDTVTKDVGLGGVCFFSEQKFVIGKVVRLKLFHDAKRPARVLKGKVVWSTVYKDSVSEGYLNGLVFLR